MNDRGHSREQTQLIQSLALALGKDGKPAQMFETHISWVIVAGEFAYKFKKAVRYDYVDYSTLEGRRFYCEEELRLNRRLAPHMYLSVVPVTGSRQRPAIDGVGEAIEYAVKMHAFGQQALWTYRIENQLILPAEIDGLATIVARFHRGAKAAPADSAWSTPDAVQANTSTNLNEIADLLDQSDEKYGIGELQEWSSTQRQKLADAFTKRKELGFVRECHGDLHSGNILTIDGDVEVFDCVEFNESLRWIDVMNDIAFTCMDLAFRQRADLAARFLNRYLEATGDYDGLAVFHYYEVNRALVRSKVALLRARQLDDDTEQARGYEQLGKNYLAFSARGTRPSRSAVMITHGFSGCGKTTFSRSLVELTGAIQIRSDVERKRMHGLAAVERTTDSGRMQLYDTTTTQSTYERLHDLARQVVISGRPVIVDAAFLRAEQRASFETLASELGVPFFVFDIQADEATMRARIASRASLQQDASDAGLEVLTHQLAHYDALASAESGHAIAVDMEPGMGLDRLRKVCRPLLDALEIPVPASCHFESEGANKSLLGKSQPGT